MWWVSKAVGRKTRLAEVALSGKSRHIRSEIERGGKTGSVKPNVRRERKSSGDVKHEQEEWKQQIYCALCSCQVKSCSGDGSKAQIEGPDSSIWWFHRAPQPEQNNVEAIRGNCSLMAPFSLGCSNWLERHLPARACFSAPCVHKQANKWHKGLVKRK